MKAKGQTPKQMAEIFPKRTATQIQSKLARLQQQGKIKEEGGKETKKQKGKYHFNVIYLINIISFSWRCSQGNSWWWP